ncbi:cyclin-dependent kinase 1-like [Drosophila innubila]|uniref:cyclin-dependent kinase 1-like n=1 Tax=Drosophila innubila TaxID=198719 RepID=UPI00148B3586|nr:cyclin-dependent kinase 1-like [Drosophila innubila]
MEKYEKIGRIGEGSYGIVYKGLVRATGELVAMKNVRNFIGAEGIPATTIREISLLRELKHPNIVALLDLLYEDNNFYLILEYLPMNLRQYIESLPPDQLMETEMVGSYLYQITCAILYCHRRRVLHRDLTPQNLLINGTGLIKVADFGLSCSFNIPMRVLTHEVVTLWYRPPEILLGSARYSCPVDIWSIGCILFEMATSKPLFQGDSEIGQLFRIFQILGTPNDDVWPGVSNLSGFNATFPNWTCNFYNLMKDSPGIIDAFIDLLPRMLTYNPSQRITAKEIIEHEFYK